MIIRTLFSLGLVGILAFNGFAQDMGGPQVVDSLDEKPRARSHYQEADASDSKDMKNFDKSILTEEMPESTPWDQGGWELSFMMGPYFGPSWGVNGGRERFNYFANNIRAAYNLTDIIGSSFYRGNVQLVGELFLAEIFNTVGGGSVVVGPNLMVRYNFIQEGWKFVPYFQLGPGLCYTDTDNNAIGSEFGFQLNAAAGCRYMLNDSWSINAEFGWHHISNAGLASSNLGSNEMGGLLGFSYFFQ